MDVVDSRTRSLFARELTEEVRYSILCFNSLYQSKFTDGLKYLPLMIRRATHEGLYDEFSEVFDRFIHSSNNEEFATFARRLRKITSVSALGDDELVVFLKILERSECKIVQSDIFRPYFKKGSCWVRLAPRDDKSWEEVEIKSIPRIMEIQLRLIPEWIETGIKDLPQKAQDIMSKLAGVGER
ncbi:hypothetical protein ES703_59311 [subsurface metagenome]